MQNNIVMRLLRRAFWIFCRIIPVNRNKVVFSSYYGRDLSDNPLAVLNALLKKKTNLKCVWVLAQDKNNGQFPEKVTYTKLNTFDYIYHMSTAKIWVDNARKQYCMKRKNQFYMQTWHGGFGLKKVEKDAFDSLEKEYQIMATRDAAMVDVMTSNSRTLSDLYRNAFWFENGEIIEKGLPRNDVLFHATPGQKQEIRESLQLPNDVRICTYAPTFRKDKGLGAYNMDYHRAAKALSERFGGKWIILLKLHPNIFKQSDAISCDNVTVFNASYYNDIQDLYLISDAVITDYSSVMFDYMLTGKPVFLYASDVEEYRKDRDFFIPLESLPFPLAVNNEEMEARILNYSAETEERNVRAFMDRHGFCETGHAADAAVKWILEKMEH